MCVCVCTCVCMDMYVCTYVRTYVCRFENTSLQGHSEGLSQRAVMYGHKTAEKQHSWPPRSPGKTNSSE